MKTKKLDRNLRELFRHNLENAEITPDPAVSKMLMRKLAVREFLRFSPSHFNIYYLTGIVAAGIATALLLTSSPGNHENKQPLEIFQKVAPKVNIEKIASRSDSASPQSNKKQSMQIVPGTEKKSPVIKNPSMEEAGEPEAATREKNAINTGTLNESLKGKQLFTKSSDTNLKLREMGVSGERLFEASVVKGCAPLRVTFKNNISDFDSCLWTFGDGGSSTSRDTEWIYDVDGEYRVVLKIFGPSGSESSASEVIEVFPRPSARFEVFPDKVSVPEDEIRFLNYSAGAVKYLWNFGDGNTSDQFEPLHKYEKYGMFNISLKVYSESGCSDSLTVYNAFSGSAYYIEFPNAFIPNINGPSGGVYSSTSDESAQVFHPSYSGVSDYHLKIFSKLGVLLFETSDINIGWDGYFKGQLTNSGVYIWKVRGSFRNGEPFTKMGDVTLLKN